MSNRLKRKLGDLGVDTSSTKANESFCLIGTPLPPLEKSRDTGEFVPLWKQDVRDEKGRRRLHGAFTGGFSAGFFNTVGSKEGWTPSTFVSSRSERAKQKASRPEDFMDEEDLQELKDSRNIVDTTEEMDFMGGTMTELQKREGMADNESDSIAHVLESSLLPAPKDSVGARILKKMGWRLGQGIGPRVTLQQRRLQDMQAMRSTLAGSLGPSHEINGANDDEEANKHTYAPRDIPIYVVKRKDNSHGLGYSPGMGLNESLGVKGSKSVKGPVISAGFGLGALNDVDDDDLDVYDGGSSLRPNRVAYDVTHGDEDSFRIGGGSQTNNKPESRSLSSGTFRDGRPVLAGFIISEQPVSEDRWFPLPEIRAGWKPDPSRVWKNDPNKENLKDVKSDGTTTHKKWKTGITADDRGALLGETPLPSAPKSVFDYISKKDQERLKNIISSGVSSSGHDRPPPSISIPRTEPHIAQAALKGFQPFTADPVKQARYIAYLQSQANSDGATSQMKPADGQSIEEFNKELEDYAKAALIFKPISGAMAGRFTSAAVIEQGPQVHEGLHTPSAEELAAKEEERRKEAEERISPKAHAAKLGMYGPMTREEKPWQPARLLCKRFGVKDPNPPPDVDSPSNDVKPQPQEQQYPSPPDTTASQSQTGPRDLDNIGLGEDETQGRDTLTYERPTMDVFKAIFASDDEDSDNDKDNDQETNDLLDASISQKPSENPVVETPKAQTESMPVDISTFRPTFIPRDGDAKGRKEAKKSKEKKKKKEKKSKLVSFEVEEEEIERPKIKAKLKHEDNDEDGMWVEKPVPEIVKKISEPVSVNQPANNAERRKKAIDFM